MIAPAIRINVPVATAGAAGSAVPGIVPESSPNVTVHATARLAGKSRGWPVPDWRTLLGLVWGDRRAPHAGLAWGLHLAFATDVPRRPAVPDTP